MSPPVQLRNAPTFDESPDGDGAELNRTNTDPAFRRIGMRLDESQRAYPTEKLFRASSLPRTQSLPSPRSMCWDSPESPPRCPRGRQDTASLVQGFSKLLDDCGSPRYQRVCRDVRAQTTTLQADLHGNDHRKRVKFGGVTVHEVQCAATQRPPNTMRLVGREWDYDDLVAAMRGRPSDSGRTWRSDAPPSGCPLPLRTHKHHLRSYHHSFKGAELVKWLVGRGAADGKQALAAAQDLLTYHVIERCDHQTRGFDGDDSLYRLWEDSRHIHGGGTFHEHVLNGRKAWVGAARHPLEVSEDLLLTLMELYTLARQDARALRGCAEFGKFAERAAELQHADLSQLSGDTARAAFFLNVHNVLVLHAHVTHPIDGVKERDTLFNKLCYDVGGSYYTATDIECGVLLCGCPQQRRFPKGDARAKWVLTHRIPQLCFALQRLSSDSVPVRMYTTAQLAEELEEACKSVLRDCTKVAQDTAIVPQMCKHLRSEMGEPAFIDFVCGYIADELSDAMRKVKRPKLVFQLPTLRPRRRLVEPI